MKFSVTALTILLAVSVAAAPANAGKRVTAAGVTLEPPAGWKLTKQPDGGAKLVNPKGDIVWRFFANEPATDLAAWFDDAWQSVTSAHSNVQASGAESTPTSTGLDGRAVAGVMNDGKGGAHILVLAAVSDGKHLAPMLIEFATQDSLTHLGDLAPASDTIKLVAKSAKPKKAFARGGWRYPISGTAPPARAATPTAPPPVQQPATPAAPTAPPAPAAQPAPPAPPPAADTKSLPFLGKWSVGQSAYSAGYSMSYGSRLLQYDFAADGTYRYHSEAWGGSFNSNWRYIVDEKGTWTASGDQLTVSPKEVTGVVRDLAGKVQKKGGPALEKVTYRFATTYFSGLKETQLVLTPPKATDRDGAFASNPSFPGSYLMRSAADYQPAFRFAPN
jgi:hypothetical protein